MLCAFLLSSCGQSTPAGYNGSPQSTVKSGTLEPLVVPPNANDAPPAPGTTGAQKTPEGLPALTAKGNNTKLFSQKLSGEVDRLDRLENAVQELRNDFDAMAPAIVRLVAIEGDIQNLIKQLEVLTGGSSFRAGEDIAPIEEASLDEPQTPTIMPPVPMPPAGMEEERDLPALTGPNGPEAPAQELPAVPSATTAPVPAQPPVPMASGPPPSTAPPPVTASAPPAPEPPAAPVATASPTPLRPATDHPSVAAIRIGAHPGKIRLVLDVSAQTAFTADLDNAEKILVVEMPQAAWNAQSEKAFTDNPLIMSYRTEKSGDNGTMLIIQLKKETSVTYKAAMASPDGGSRIIIDLATQ